MRLQDIETNGEVHVCRVNQHHVFHPLGGDATQKLVNQITVGIKHGDTVAVLNILPD